MFKKDNLKLGIILGFLGPVLGLVIYYFAAFYTKHVGFAEFLGYLKQYRSLLTGVSSISLVANAILFTIYINSRRDQTAKGIFIATLIYGIGVLVLKFVA
ncbi:MAG TPA: hypothetical protein VJ647_04510 [Chitinophagaceae bacterium]|nr:hypothetical protein [Chitinophagaceae bacterium]